MRLRHIPLAITTALLTATAGHARVTDEQVRQAIQRNIDALYRLQNDRGTFPVGSGEIGESTAALRAALLDIQYGRAW